MQAALHFVGPRALPAGVVAGPAGFARSLAEVHLAAHQALPAVAAVGPAELARSLAEGHLAARQALPAAVAADPWGSARWRAARRSGVAHHSGALPVAGVADWPAPERRRAASHGAAGPAVPAQARARGAPDRAKSAPQEEVHEAPGRAAFARQAAARPGAAVVAERAARWRAPVGREVRWRLAGVAGQALRAAARLELGAGRGAACRLPGAERLAQGAFRR